VPDNLNLRTDRLESFARALVSKPWPEVRKAHSDVIRSLERSDAKTGMYIRAVDRSYSALIHRVQRLQKQGRPIPADVRSFLDGRGLGRGHTITSTRRVGMVKFSPASADLRRLRTAMVALLGRLARFGARPEAILEYRRSVVSPKRTLKHQGRAPTRGQEETAAAIPPKPIRTGSGTAASTALPPLAHDRDALAQFVTALATGEVVGELYLAGDISPETIKNAEGHLEDAIGALGGTIEWGKSRVGSWWRRFVATIQARVDERDLDTLKRAGVVHVLDKHEAESARGYADAIKSLSEALQGVDHGYLAAKNVVMLKTVDENGVSALVARVLTPQEVNRYERGELATVLENPTTALTFMKTGIVPVPDRPAGELGGQG
jgi:hypothetical protein